MTSELIAPLVDVTQRGLASRLLKKVEPKKYVGKRFDGEVQWEKVHRTRSAG